MTNLQADAIIIDIPRSLSTEEAVNALLRDYEEGLETLKRSVAVKARGPIFSEGPVKF